MGRLFRYTNNSFVAAFSGIDWNRERYSSEAKMSRKGESAEAIFGTQVNFYRFKTTKYSC